MALSQKHEGKILTPWYNSEEWRSVYKQLYFSNDNEDCFQKALKILRVWKSRMSLLSSGVEGTLIVLEALLCDRSTTTDNLLRNIYGTALMRFLNLCAANNEKQGTFYETAKKHNIPDWMIDLRHSFAHSHDLPRLDILTIGLKHALKWLYAAYWQPQNDLMQDWIVDPSTSKKSNLDELFHSLCLATYKLYHKEELDYEHYIELFNNDDNFGNPINIRHLQKNVLKKLKESYSGCDKCNLVEIFIKVSKILEDTHMHFDGDTQLSSKFLTTWEYIFTYFNECRLLAKLLEILNNTTISWICNEETKIFASMLIKEIINGLIKQKCIKKHKSKNEENADESIDASKYLDTSKFVLNLKTFKKSTVEEMNSFREAILTYPNKYALNYVESLHKLCDYPDDYITDIVTLIKTSTSVSPELNKSIKTLSEKEINDFNSEILRSYHNKENKVANGRDECLDESMECDSPPTKKMKVIWRRVVDTSQYHGIPLGAIPGQSRTLNPLLSCME